MSGAVAATQRPALAALLAYVREGRAVVVAAIDRLGRNTIDVLSTVDTLRAKGVLVVSMRESFDLAMPAGKFMLTMLAAVAELERVRAEGKNLGRTKAIDDAAGLACRELWKHQSDSGTLRNFRRQRQTSMQAQPASLISWRRSA